MPASRLAPHRDDDTEIEAAEEAAAPAASPGPSGFRRWLPLVLNMVLMPVLAYVTTTWLLIPQLKSADQGRLAKASPDLSDPSAAHQPGLPASATKFVAPLNGKVLVNLAGTMGTRYLLASITLVSPQSDLKNMIEKNDAQLRDAAAGVLACKTIADLEKPDARNQVRAELISVFNHVLGASVVTELYLTEFAIQ